jgi:hypothetical protein
MKKFGNILLAFATLAGVVACSENALDEVNRDVDHAHDAEAKFVFADVTTATAFTVVGGDFNTYLGVAVEHWGGVHNQLYKADQRDGEWTSSSCFNNNWVGIYNVIKNAREVVAKTADDATGVDAGNKALNGAAKTILAYNSAVLTDLFGDTPYTEACDYYKYPNPKIDKQEDIYRDIKSMLDQAITQLTGQKTLGTGNFDFIYGGNAAKWLKFAYALRARVALHTILRASDKTAVYVQILSDIENSFASSADQAQFAKYDGDSQLSPLGAFQYSREALGASKSIAEKYAERNDPRGDIIFCGNYWVDGCAHYTMDNEGFDPVPNGEGIEAQEWYSEDCYLWTLNAPTYLLSYAELQFIKAEVLARMGRTVEAKAATEEAIKAAFEITNVNVESAQNCWGFGYEGDYLSDADAIAYYDAVVAPKTGEAFLAEVMVQKYLSFHGANGGSVEAFNDIRRLKAEGKNYISLANPKNSTKFPLRCGYGSSDTTTNPNVQTAFGDGSYVYKEPVWWAMGTK